MPRARRPLAVAIALLALFLVPSGVTAEEPDHSEQLRAFQKALRSKDAAKRARAFELLRSVDDPAVVGEITRGIRKLDNERASIQKQQAAAEEAYGQAFTDIEKANAALRTATDGGKSVERFNREALRLTRIRDDAVDRLERLQAQFKTNRALLRQGVGVMGEILESLRDEAFEEALARLSKQWLEAKDIRWKQRWVAAVRDVRRPQVTEMLRAAVSKERMPASLRVSAIGALAARDDPWIIAKGKSLLSLPLEQSRLVRAAIDALRTIHDKDCIPPLIAFLAREDLKEERNLARKALISLTGVDHKAYAGPWRTWWRDEAATFAMPKTPSAMGDLAPAASGTSFYGIQTFSDRILYIVDVSGSMAEPQRGTSTGGKSKMDVCKQELIGSVHSLNKTDTFNVLLLNHRVIRWQAKSVQATERNKRRLETWIKDHEPSGGTNIHDSLEQGFLSAQAEGGAPVYDTIFFLTDGKPTAGKIRDMDTILEVVRDWNETARMTIHAIGIGRDHNAAFLEALARIGDGKYVRR